MATMKRLLLIILIFNYKPLLSQQFDKDVMFALTDSIVINHTDSIFLSKLIRNPEIELFEYVSNKRDGDFDQGSIDKIYSESIKVTDYWVEYILKPQVEYSYHIKNERGGMGPASFFIQLGEKNIVKELPDFTLYVRALNRFEESEIINKKIAISKAQDHFSPKTRDSNSVLLIFDEKDSSLYWRVSRQKGFRNVKEEHVLIHANNENFIRVETSSYFRSFWTTITDIFSGFY